MQLIVTPCPLPPPPLNPIHRKGTTAHPSQVTQRKKTPILVFANLRQSLGDEGSVDVNYVHGVRGGRCLPEPGLVRLALGRLREAAAYLGLGQAVHLSTKAVYIIPAKSGGTASDGGEKKKEATKNERTS